MGRRTWCQFAVMSALYMAVWLSCSIIAPFFPPEVIKKGANQTDAGLVFGAFSLTSFIAGPLFGSVVPRIGGKVMFLIGAGLCGCTNVIFGVLDKIQNGTIFVTSALLMRVMEALGSSAAMIAAMAMVGGKYPEHAPQLLGLLEMFSGLAFMIGPLIGTFLYQAGGYRLPFFTLGGICLLLIALNVCVLPREELIKPKGEGPFSLLRIPAVWPVAVTLFISTTSLAVFNIGITNYTQKVGLLSPRNAGIVFFVQGGSYALSTPLFGWILNKLMKYFRVTTRVMLILGSMLSSVSFFMIGPSPWLPFLPSNMCALLVSCFLIGVSMGVVCVPSIVDMVATAEWYGFPEGSATYGMASGVFLSCFHLGSFVGSTVGGALIDQYNFEVTTSVVAMCNLVSVSVVVLSSSWEYQCGRGRTLPGTYYRQNTPDETSEMLMPLVANKNQDQDGSVGIVELVSYELEY